MLIHFYFFEILYFTCSVVDHSVFKNVLPWCLGWGVQSQVLPLLELTARSLSSTTTAPQVSSTNGGGSVGNTFIGFTRNWTRDSFHQSQRPLTVPHCFSIVVTHVFLCKGKGKIGVVLLIVLLATDNPYSNCCMLLTKCWNRLKQLPLGQMLRRFVVFVQDLVLVFHWFIYLFI